MPFRLTGLMLDRVDLCGVGANPKADIVLFKSQEKETNVPQTRKKKPVKKVAKPDSRTKATQRGDDDQDEDEEEETNRRVAKGRRAEDEDADEDEEEEEETPRRKAVAKGGDDEDEDEDDEADDEEEEDEAPVKKSKGKGKPANTGKTKVAKRTAADDDDAADDQDDEEDDDAEDVPERVLKSLPASVRQMIEKQNQRLRRIDRQAREARETARLEKARRERVEYIEKAKTDLPHLTGSDEEKGEVLQALYSGEPIEKSMVKRIVKLLKSGSAALASLMQETGRSARRDDDDDSAHAQMIEKRDELMEADPKLTREQAIMKVAEVDPKLYARYREEKRRERRVN